MITVERIALVLVLAAALALAGCLGGGDDADAASTDPGSTDQQDPAGENDTAEDETEDVPALVWNRTTREGSVTGGNVGGLAFTTDDSEQNFTVVDGTRNLTLNVSTESNEVTMRVAPPGCDNSAGSSCTTTVTTEDGEARWATDDPDPGQWSTVFFRGNDGYGEVRYELGIDRLEPNPAADG